MWQRVRNRDKNREKVQLMHTHTHTKTETHTHTKHAHTYTYTHVHTRQFCESFKLLAIVVCGGPFRYEGTQVRSSSDGRTGSVFNEKEIIVNSTRLKIQLDLKFSQRNEEASQVYFLRTVVVADWLVGWNNDRLMTGARYSSVGTRSLVSRYSHSSQVDRMC